VRWSLNVVLICISFMARIGKHFFMYFLAICMSTFEKCSYCSDKSFVFFHQGQSQTETLLFLPPSS
jgi:hypothetical protein